MKPWWKYAQVWMLIAGPAIVVIAGLATLMIALAHPDPVLPRDADGANFAPALQARNHAQTGAPGQVRPAAD